MNTQIDCSKSSLLAITTIRDWYSSPESDYPRNSTRRAKAAMADLRRLNAVAYDQICEVADQTNQVVSRGFVTVYLNGHQLGDPHKGSVASRAAICIDVLFRVYEAEMERLGFRSEKK